MFFQSSTGALKVVVGEPPASGPFNLGYGFTSLEAMYVIPWDPAVTLPADTVYSGGFARTSKGALYVTVGTPSAAEKSFGVPARTAKGVAFVTTDAPAGGSTYTAPWGMCTSAGVLHIADLTFGVEFADVGSGEASIVAGIGGVTATFTRATVASCRLSNGLLKKVATGVPRSHYSSAGTYLGYLAEGARTNLCLQSEVLSVTWSLNRSTQSTNAAVAPDGTTTADKLIEDATAGNTHFVSQSFTFANVVHSASVFAKAGERTWIRLGIFDGVTSHAAFFDLATGATGTASNVTPTIENWGNGWYRCSIVTTAAVAAAVGTMQVQLASDGATVAYNGDGVSGAYVWGAQLEAAAFASSYIPTTTIAVARNADVLTYPTTGWHVAATGTLFVQTLDAPAGAGAIYWQIDDGTGNERFIMARTSGNNARFQVLDGGATQADLGTGTSDSLKMAGAYAANDFAQCRDGGTVATDATGTLPTVTTARIGGDSGAGSLPFVPVRRVGYYNSRLANGNLQQITA